MAVRRFGVSLEEDILAELDAFVVDNQFPNRSQAIRHLIELQSIDKKWLCDNEVAGAVVLVYDHHKNDISRQANDIQHDYHHLILSTQHIHLDHDMCLETITVKGKAGKLQKLADKLRGIKGIQHSELVMSATN